MKNVMYIEFPGKISIINRFRLSMAEATEDK